MLQERYPDLHSLLIPRERFQPCPKDPDWWASRDGQWAKEVLAEAEERKDEAYAQLTAVRYMDFQRDGNRTRYEGLCFSRRYLLYLRAVAELIENKGTYIDSIIDGIWLICEETSWCIPAHNELSALPRSSLPDPEQPFLDLFAGETAGNMAYIYYLLGDRLAEVSPLIPRRMAKEITSRVIDPFLLREDFRWMGQNTEGGFTCNWNPWIVSNVLTCLALVETDPYRRTAGVRKSLRLLDRFIATYHSDGGCDEGPSYWGAAAGALFHCLELLYRVSDGKIDYFDLPIIGEMGRYITRTHISGQYFVNFADCHPKLLLNSSMVQAYGRRVGDAGMEGLAAYARRHQSYQHKTRSTIHDFRSLLLQLTAEPGQQDGQPPFYRYVWMDGVQVMTARQFGGSDKGLFLAAKGGHNGENHNHNDVGNMIVYLDGRPVLVDSGAEAYSALTFRDETRYTLWTMVSDYHNLPTVRGAGQYYGTEFAAREVASSDREGVSVFSCEIAGAYPPEAGLRSWVRTAALDREKETVSVEERFDLGEKTADITLNFLCGPRPVPEGNTARIGDALLTWDAGWKVAVEKVNTEDARVKTVFGEDSLYRLRLTPQAPVAQGELHWYVQRA